ncbi:MAG: hypothetical protein J0M18_16975 [Ignavibacteria bacterium]|nr:hypothetical protein [Ignavibacteria bacterium]
MNFLKKLFKRKEKTLLTEIEPLVDKVIIKSYRDIAKKINGAPSAKTSDEKILDIYRKVLIAFKAEASQRGERIPAVNLNSIALKFMQVYEMSGEEFFNEHLEYEIIKYHNEGLREDYKRHEITFF